MADLVYVYAVLPRPVAVDARGVSGGAVRWVTSEHLAAAVSDVPSDEFDEEPLNTKVRDMAWLGPRALAHQDINARLFDLAEAMVPLAFGTVFRDDERVAEMLRDRSASLNERLQAVSGAGEWVVAFHQIHQPEPDTLAVKALRGEIDSSSPGRAHLLRRQLATLERDEARRLTSEATDQLLGAVRAIVNDVYVEPLPTDTLERPLLRASVLVARGKETHFVDEVERLRQRWSEPTYRLLLTGPWPPYRFGGLYTERD